jgi:hypothetical protein
MSIPLDRLYNFLDDHCDQDILIYRWSPHGSRKISDLKPLHHVNLAQHNLSHFTELPIMVFCNDQEPLNFDYYNNSDHYRELCQHGSYNVADLEDTETIQRIVEHMNIKVSVERRLFLWALKDSCVLLHSEQRSPELQKYQDLDFVPAYWWSHAIIARDWFRYAEHDPVLAKSKNIEQDFLIYNRAWAGTREYRLKFVDLLIQNNLIANCKTKFNPVDQVHYTQHCFKNQEFKPTNSLEHVLPLNTADASASADYVGHDYAATGIEIVLETLFDDSRLHLTEKILRPIACGQPFVLAATAGSLQYLRSYGFETFDGLINESYDTVQDPTDRLQAIVNEMKRIAELPLDQKLNLYQRLGEIATRNKQRFFSSEFNRCIIAEFQQNFDQAFQHALELRQSRWHRARTVGIV